VAATQGKIIARWLTAVLGLLVALATTLLTTTAAANTAVPSACLRVVSAESQLFVLVQTDSSPHLRRGIGQVCAEHATGPPLASKGGVGLTDDAAKLSGMLRDAVKGKGNFGIGQGTRAQSQAMGEAWVGDGFKVASDGKILISRDGLRQYRPPSFKPRLGKTQANFEQRFKSEGQWQGNAHLDIVD